MTQIKICGITKDKEIDMLNRADVDYAGFVIYEKSKRYISVSDAAELKSRLKPAIKSVAVTVSPDITLVKEIEAAGFDVIQIHNELKEEVLRQTSHPVWRAINIADISDAKNTLIKDEKDFKDLCGKISGYVADAVQFGSGKTFDWTAGAKIGLKDKVFVLAGGLNPGNVEEGIGIFCPDIVDVSSSVEGDDGKDEEKIRNFVDAVKRADLHIMEGGATVEQ